jgi:hypothetical protein
MIFNPKFENVTEPSTSSVLFYLDSLFQGFTKCFIQHFRKTACGILLLNSFCLTDSDFFIKIFIDHYGNSYAHNIILYEN